MPRFVAFLRGINVGGHRVGMDRLRVLFEEMGLSDVTTFLASGNVVFSTDSKDVAAMADRIERYLTRGLGYEVPTFLRSPAHLGEIVAFGARDGGGEPEADDVSTYVVLLRDPASAEVRSRFAGLESDTDAFRVSGTEIYWRIRGKLSESPLFGRGIEAALDGVPATTRNMNTIRRLANRLGDARSDGG